VHVKDKFPLNHVTINPCVASLTNMRHAMAMIKHYSKIKLTRIYIQTIAGIIRNFFMPKYISWHRSKQ